MWAETEWTWRMHCDAAQGAHCDAQSAAFRPNNNARPSIKNAQPSIKLLCDCDVRWQPAREQVAKHFASTRLLVLMPIARPMNRFAVCCVTQGHDQERNGRVVQIGPEELAAWAHVMGGPEDRAPHWGSRRRCLSDAVACPDWRRESAAGWRARSHTMTTNPNLSIRCRRCDNYHSAASVELARADNSTRGRARVDPWPSRGEIDGQSLPVSSLINACLLELIASRIQSVISTMS